MFYTQDFEPWQVGAVSLGSLLVAVLMNSLLIPATPSIEVRGTSEMYPLNGPSWSLFFEYIANILYALVLRRLSLPQLRLWVGAMAVGLASFAVLSEWGAYRGGLDDEPGEYAGR